MLQSFSKRKFVGEDEELKMGTAETKLKTRNVG